MQDLPTALLRPTPVSLDEKILHSLSDMTQLLGLSEPTVRALVRRGLPCLRIGRRPMFRRESVDLWLAEQERKHGDLLDEAHDLNDSAIAGTEIGCRLSISPHSHSGNEPR